MKDPIYDLIMILHVLSATIGFGTLIASGIYSLNFRKCKDVYNSKHLKTYFTGKTNYMGYVIFFVPVFGVILLYMGHWHQLTHPYPWVGISCWGIGALVANLIIFPQEKLIGIYLNENKLTQQERSKVSMESNSINLQQISLRIERAAAVAAICFTLATVFMVIQPSF